jgi:glycosyltransferase involved in cell wall biosynthesis
MFLPYQTKDLARQHLSLEERKATCVYVGHLYKKKGIATILEIAKLMPECQFILVGGWEK